MEFLSRWEDELEQEDKEIRDCHRAIRLFGDEICFEKLEEEYLELENEVANCLVSLAANIDEVDALCECEDDAEMYEASNEKMYDIFNAYLRIARGEIDTDETIYSTMFDADECEHWIYVTTLIYERICNKIKSIKILVENA